MMKRKTQPIHKSYPVLCTQHVENSVEGLGTTGGNEVTNAGTSGKRSHHPVGYPRFPHTGCAQINGPAWEDPAFPVIHSTYDYDLVLTNESQEQVGSRPARGSGYAPGDGLVIASHIPRAGPTPTSKHRRYNISRRHRQEAHP